MPSSPGIGMFVEVKDPDDKIVLSRVCIAEHITFHLLKLVLLFNYPGRFTVLRAGLPLHHILLASMSFVCTQTAQSGFLELNWYLFI